MRLTRSLPRRRSVALALALGLGAAPLTAQGVADAAARIGWASLMGDDYSAVKGTLGFEAFLRWSLPAGVGIQGGAHYASHEIEGAGDKLGLLSLYLEPRYILPVSLGVRGAAPFLGLRGLYARFENVTGEADVNADGWGVGGVGGLLLPITARLGIGLSAWYSALSSGTAKFNDIQVLNSGRSGGLLAFQVAIFASTGR